MGVMYRRCTASVYALRHPERQLLIRPFLRESPGRGGPGLLRLSQCDVDHRTTRHPSLESERTGRWGAKNWGSRQGGPSC